MFRGAILNQIDINNKKKKTHKETLLEGKKELLKEKNVKRW